MPSGTAASRTLSRSYTRLRPSLRVIERSCCVRLRTEIPSHRPFRSFDGEKMEAGYCTGVNILLNQILF